MRIYFNPLISAIANRESKLSIFLIYSCFKSLKKIKMKKESLNILIEKQGLKERTVKKYILEALDVGLIEEDSNFYFLREKALVNNYLDSMKEKKDKSYSFLKEISKVKVGVNHKALNLSVSKKELRNISLNLIYYASNSKKTYLELCESKVIVPRRQETLANYLNVSLRTFSYSVTNSNLIKTEDCVYEIPDFINPQYHEEAVRVSQLLCQKKKFSTPCSLRMSGALEIRVPSVVKSSFKLEDKARKYNLKIIESKSEQKTEKTSKVKSGMSSIKGRGKNLRFGDGRKRKTQPLNSQIFNPLSRRIKTPHNVGKHVFNFISFLVQEYEEEFGSRKEMQSIFTLNADIKSLFTHINNYNKSKVKPNSLTIISKDEALKVIKSLFGRFRIGSAKVRLSHHKSIVHAMQESIDNSPLLYKQTRSMANRDGRSLAEEYSEYLEKENNSYLSEVYDKFNIFDINFYAQKSVPKNAEFFAKALPKNSAILEQQKTIPQFTFIKNEASKTIKFKDPKESLNYNSPHRKLRSETGPLYKSFYNMKRLNSLTPASVIKMEAFMWDDILLTNPTGKRKQEFDNLVTSCTKNF